MRVEDARVLEEITRAFREVPSQPRPVDRVPYREAMLRYGSNKPNWRIQLSP